MSSFKNAFFSRVHLERGQPSERKRLGLLEKHSDYVKRAADYHRKEKALKRFSERSRQRNVDEFSFKMLNSSQLPDGRIVLHQKPKNYSLSQVDLDHSNKAKAFKKLLIKQVETDLRFVNFKKDLEERKLSKLKVEVSSLDVDSKGKKSSRIIFEDDSEYSETKKPSTVDAVASREGNHEHVAASISSSPTLNRWANRFAENEALGKTNGRKTPTRESLDFEQREIADARIDCSSEDDSTRTHTRKDDNSRLAETKSSAYTAKLMQRVEAASKETKELSAVANILANKRAFLKRERGRRAGGAEDEEGVQENQLKSVNYKWFTERKR